MGDWEEFLEIYKEFVPEETMTKINMLRTQTLAYNNEDNVSILQQSPIILQLPGDTGEGLYNTPQISQNIEDSMMNRISEIKQNRYQLPVDPHMDDKNKHQYK